DTVRHPGTSCEGLRAPEFEVKRLNFPGFQAIANSLALFLLARSARAFPQATRRYLMLEFQIGDKAVYPAQGVAEVVGIDSKEINGTVCSFYVLKVLDSEMQILVPKDKADQVGLRPIATNEEVEEVFDILREQDVHIDKQTWNRRYR